MDIQTQVAITLRTADYETWSVTNIVPEVTCFENHSIIGFVHAFDSADALLAEWEERQTKVLARHAATLRIAGTKAWNVYSVFLTAEKTPFRQREIERLEEDFRLTRKIARGSIQTPRDIERALLPLTGLKSQPLLNDSNFEERLRSRLKNLPMEVVSTFLRNNDADEIARMLGRQP